MPGFAQTVVAVANALERAQARQVQVREGAGVEALGRLDQRHAHLGRLLLSGSAQRWHHPKPPPPPITTTWAEPAWARHDGGQRQGGSPGQGAAQKGTALQAHGCTSWLNQAASAWICDSS